MLPHVMIYLLMFLLDNYILYGECRIISSSSTTTNEQQRVPALYVFGDSSTDCGNNNFPDSLAAKYPPYGIDFWNSQPTGRVTNGKILPDLLCEYLNLPYALPYNIQPKPTGWLTGYSYSSGGSGILPQTRLLDSTSLEGQIQNFKNTIEEDLRPFMDAEELKQHLSQSIFLIVIGTNDYMVNYFGSKFNSSTIYTPQEFADLLVNTLSQYLEDLYKLGVRKAMLSELTALGCMPKTRIGVECNKTKNEIVSIYNVKFHGMVHKLSATLKDSHFTVANIYNLTYDAYFNPSKYGLTNSRDACCRLLGTSGACQPTLLGIPQPCRNRSKYFYWDGHHPTEAFYSIVADKCIQGNSTCLPYNIQQLVQLPN